MSDDTATPEAQQVEGLPEPPPILILTMVTDRHGRSSVQYQTTKEQAISILREMADSMEAETSG